MEKHICRFCGKEFSSGQKIGGHIVIHSPDRQEVINKIRQSETLERITIIKNCEKCGKEFEVVRNLKKNKTQIISKKEVRFCSRSCANGHKHSEEWKENISQGLKGKTSWYIDGRSLKKYYCECGREMRKGSKFCKECFYKTTEYKEKLSKSLKGKTGGYREGGGRSKGGYYKNKHFDSMYEIEIAQFLDENNIIWKRNTKRMYFEWKGRKTYYIPDFYLPSIDAYLETKGYYWTDKKARTLEAVRVNKLRWIELMQRDEWGKDHNILLEKINKIGEK